MRPFPLAPVRQEGARSGHYERILFVVADPETIAKIARTVAHPLRRLALPKEDLADVGGGLDGVADVKEMLDVGEMPVHDLGSAGAVAPVPRGDQGSG